MKRGDKQTESPTERKSETKKEGHVDREPDVPCPCAGGWGQASGGEWLVGPVVAGLAAMM